MRRISRPDNRHDRTKINVKWTDTIVFRGIRMTRAAAFNIISDERDRELANFSNLADEIMNAPEVSECVLQKIKPT